MDLCASYDEEWQMFQTQLALDSRIGAARALLRVAESHPEAVLDALHR